MSGGAILQPLPAPAAPLMLSYISQHYFLPGTFYHCPAPFHTYTSYIALTCIFTAAHAHAHTSTGSLYHTALPLACITCWRPHSPPPCFALVCMAQRSFPKHRSKNLHSTAFLNYFETGTPPTTVTHMRGLISLLGFRTYSFASSHMQVHSAWPQARHRSY